MTTRATLYLCHLKWKCEQKCGGGDHSLLCIIPLLAFGLASCNGSERERPTKRAGLNVEQASKREERLNSPDTLWTMECRSAADDGGVGGVGGSNGSAYIYLFPFPAMVETSAKALGQYSCFIPLPEQICLCSSLKTLAADAEKCTRRTNSSSREFHR